MAVRIGFENNAPFIEGLNAQGVCVTPGHFSVFSGSHLVHWELVKQGVDIGVFTARIGDAEPFVRRAAPEKRL